MTQIIDIFLHLDQHLSTWVNILGPWSYALLFMVIFIETGAVILPFLPGDSLLFAAGATAALPHNVLDPWALLILFWVAALSGDSLNFVLGRKIGLPLIQHPFLGRFITEKNLDDTKTFFIKHGKLAIILARFLPIIRTLAPFTAALSGYPYRQFIILDTVAATLWVLIGVWCGYFFGQVPFIQHHFSLVILGILFVTVLPAVIGAIRARLKK